MRKKSRRTGTKKHEVKANLANFELAKARSSLTLDIYARDVKIGELEIGRGSLYWQGRSRKKSKRLDWSKFADKMDELAYGEKRSSALEDLAPPKPAHRRRKAGSRAKARPRKRARSRKKAPARNKPSVRKKIGPRKKVAPRRAASRKKAGRKS